MTEIRKIIGDNLKTISRLRNIKNVQIAEYMEVSPGSVTNWFKGSNSIDIENLYKLCGYLGVSLDQVFGTVPLNPEVVLSDDEARLLAAYRSADDRARDDALKTLLDHPKKTVESTAG